MENKLSFIVLVSAVAALGSGEPCTREYEPVCGTDNVTYDNRCLFENASENNYDLEIAYEGTCEADNAVDLSTYDFGGICTLEYAPVCGTDDVTYGNMCTLVQAYQLNNDIGFAYDGECQ